MTPTKEEMIKRIYEEIMYPQYNRGHTMVMGCCMLGDVLEYWIRKRNNRIVPASCSWEAEDDKKFMVDLRYLLHMRGEKRKPIDEQSEECISFIYSLLPNDTNN